MRFSLLLTVLLAFLCAPVALARQSLGLQSLDRQPLGGRSPLILVHGINPEVKKTYSWQGFLQAAKADPDFAGRYKTYLFVYNPSLAVAENGRKLHDALSDLEKTTPGARPLRFAALSLGGLIVKEALNDETLWQQTDRIIALGVPFHGTPLANPPWIRASLRQAGFLNPVRRTDGLAYWISRRKFPHFQDDYCWDNFDMTVPPGIDSCMKPTSTHRPEDDLRKYVTYAGFFGATPDERLWLRQVLISSEGGLEPSYRLRGQSLSRHLMFRLVRPPLAYLPLARNPEPGFLPTQVYNDGISPVSSQLWLGRMVQPGINGEPVTQAALWAAVKNLQGGQQARLFEGLDHRDWLSGRTRFKNDEGKLADWLHPQALPRTIYDWILYDLMRD